MYPYGGGVEISLKTEPCNTYKIKMSPATIL